MSEIEDIRKRDAEIKREQFRTQSDKDRRTCLAEIDRLTTDRDFHVEACAAHQTHIDELQTEVAQLAGSDCCIEHDEPCGPFVSLQNENARLTAERDTLTQKLMVISGEKNALAEEAKQLRIERDEARAAARRWNAIMSTARFHFMGCAGFDLKGRTRKLADLTLIPKDGELHFGVEFWSEFDWSYIDGKPDGDDQFCRELLEIYADEMIARAALKEKPDAE